MCQEKTVFLCKHSSYRMVYCTARRAQRSSCFSFAPAPPCQKTVRTKQSNQLCTNCLRRENRVTMWPSQPTEPAPTPRNNNNTRTHGFQQARLPQQPQAARLRLEPEPLNADNYRAHHDHHHHRRTVPPGLDLGSVAADAYHFAQNKPTQQPSHLIVPTNVDTTRRVVSPVPRGFAHARLVTPQTSVEELRAEAQRRVVDGQGNFF